jgi:hypothetical protein
MNKRILKLTDAALHSWKSFCRHDPPRDKLRDWPLIGSANAEGRFTGEQTRTGSYSSPLPRSGGPFKHLHTRPRSQEPRKRKPKVDEKFGVLTREMILTRSNDKNLEHRPWLIVRRLLSMKGPPI